MNVSCIPGKLKLCVCVGGGGGQVAFFFRLLAHVAGQVEYSGLFLD